MDESLQEQILEIGKRAKTAASIMSAIPASIKNKALNAMADALEAHQIEIVSANRTDLQQGEEKGLPGALLDRLTLNETRIKSMAAGLREIAILPDPVGEVLGMTRRPNGIEVGRIRVPIGVVGIIYEARPNVTADAAGLSLKSGNAVVLRGGSESLSSNRIITAVISAAAEQAGIPAGAIQLIDSAKREAAVMMMKMDDYLDVLIPRGGKGLKKVVAENASVPYIMTGMGNCHVYVDEYADLDKARKITYNAKVQRPSVCNAAETLLVHQAVAGLFLPDMIKELQQAGVEIRGCELTQKLAGGDIKKAVESDWDEEYLDLIMAVKVVDGLEEAIHHINVHGTGHSEAIISENYTQVRKFMTYVDAAAVYANASTRFTDGNEFGLGAEMGISTQKLHARGPMGLRELTTIKYIIYGDGQIRA